MAAGTCLLVVEGPHDSAVVARLLQARGLKPIRHDARLPDLWSPLVPRSFPVHGDLLARHPVPHFLNDANGRSVALIAAGGGGIPRIAQALHDHLQLLGFRPEAVGVVVDADDEAPRVLHRNLLNELGRLGGSGGPRVLLPDLPGIIERRPEGRAGVFFAPDNENPGTMERLLLDAAETIYPALLAHARGYVRDYPRDGLEAQDLIELRKPAGIDKAVVHSLAALLKPAKAIQVSIQDNRWFEPPALQQPRIAALDRFLQDLLDH